MSETTKPKRRKKKTAKRAPRKKAATKYVAPPVPEFKTLVAAHHSVISEAVAAKSPAPLIITAGIDEPPSREEVTAESTPIQATIPRPEYGTALEFLWVHLIGPLIIGGVSVWMVITLLRLAGIL